jgi:dihydrofolate reductase
VEDDIEAIMRRLKTRLVTLGLIDEYRVCFHSIVLGRGKRFFAGARPLLPLVASDRTDEGVIKLTYVPV